MQRELQDPAQYAELWMRDGGDPHPVRRAQLYEAWLDDFGSRDVEAIGFSLVTLRRPATGGPTLQRVEDLPRAVARRVGPRPDRPAASRAVRGLVGDALVVPAGPTPPASIKELVTIKDVTQIP